MEHSIGFLAPAKGAGALGCDCTSQVIRFTTSPLATGVSTDGGMITDGG